MNASLRFPLNRLAPSQAGYAYAFRWLKAGYLRVNKKKASDKVNSRVRPRAEICAASCIPAI
jgi:hypothetical protein